MWTGRSANLQPPDLQSDKLLTALSGPAAPKCNLSCLMTKPTKWHVRTAKTQISLGICRVWSVSLQCSRWVAKNPRFFHTDSEETDQTGRIVILLVLSWDGSFMKAALAVECICQLNETWHTVCVRYLIYYMCKISDILYVQDIWYTICVRYLIYYMCKISDILYV